MSLREHDIRDLVKRNEYKVILDFNRNRIGIQALAFIIPFPSNSTGLHSALCDDNQMVWVSMKDKDELIEDLKANSRVQVILKQSVKTP